MSRRPPPFRLVPDTLSGETVECLEELLTLAKKGEVIGVAFAAVMKGRTYIVNTAGEARRSPTFTRGMVSSLDDEVGRRVWSD